MIAVSISFRKRLLWAVLVLLIQGRPAQGVAQQIPERYQSIPGDSLSLTSIDVASLRNRKDLEIVPWEILSAFGKQELGIDPLLISSIDIVAGMPSINGPEFGVSITTKTPVDIANLNGKLFSGIGKIELKLVASDSESAAKLAGALDRLRMNGMVLAEQAILQALKNEPQVSAEVKAASMLYMQRLKVFLSKAELWTVNGNDMDIIGCFRPTGSNVGFFDGSVRFLARSIDPGVLQAMITHAGGEVIPRQ